MRRVILPILVSLGLALSAAAPAAAAPTPTPTPTPTSTALAIPVPAATPGKAVCTVDATNVALDMTGLVATKTGYAAIDGGSPSERAWSLLRVIYLTKDCKRDGSLQSYSSPGAIDPQDLAIDAKGVLWIADTGAEALDPTRELISLWKVPARTGAMTHYKFQYPDGAHNTEAMLLGTNGQPIFVTKEITGPASIYTVTGKLSTTATMTLTKAGTFQPEQTGTVNKLGSRGQAQNAITGGAVSPDGTKAVLRTLSDAYEWDVTGGDIIAAITKGKPRITPLPNEDQGYSIAYTPDGASFMTVSYSNDSTSILQYTPAKAVVTPRTGGAKNGPATPGALRKWFNALTYDQLIEYLVGVGVFGLLLVLLGVFGIRRARRKAPPPPLRRTVPTGGPGPVGPGGPGRPAGPATPGVYGAPRGDAGRGGYADNAPRSPVGYDPYADPYADPYGAPPVASPPGGAYQGGTYQGGGGQYGGGSYQGGQQGGQHPGGQYGAPVDPYHDDYGAPDDRRPSPYGRPDGGYRG